MTKTFTMINIRARNRVARLRKSDAGVEALEEDVKSLQKKIDLYKTLLTRKTAGGVGTGRDELASGAAA
jgi:hypothetical protein